MINPLLVFWLIVMSVFVVLTFLYSSLEYTTKVYNGYFKLPCFSNFFC